MRTLVIVALLSVAIAQSSPLLDCLKAQCPTQYTSCSNDILGCAPKAYSCVNKCADNVQCLNDCAYASGNKKLIALADCGNANCQNVIAQAFLQIRDMFQKLLNQVGTVQDCLKTKCTTQYNTCAADIFGCAPKANACNNKCGDNAQCLLDCALASGNAKLIALAKCGEVNCATAAFQTCDYQTCVLKFQEACGNTENLGDCAVNFWTQDAECLACLPQ